jgi:tRNA(fMet)-specific endonuclease VapC
MSVEFFLDTNILSDIVRSPRGAAAAQYRRHRGVTAISIIVAAELRYGLQKNPSYRHADRVDDLLRAVPIIPLEEPADAHYAELRAGLSRLGTPLGPNDYWIAAHALALDCILVTANEREFRRVPRLRVQNWTA